MCAGAHAKHAFSSVSFNIIEKVRNIFGEFTDINVYKYPFGAAEVECTQTDRRTARVISTGDPQRYELRLKTEFLPNSKHPRSSNTNTR